MPLSQCDDEFPLRSQTVLSTGATEIGSMFIRVSPWVPSKVSD